MAISVFGANLVVNGFNTQRTATVVPSLYPPNTDRVDEAYGGTGLTWTQPIGYIKPSSVDDSVKVLLT